MADTGPNQLPPDTDLGPMVLGILWFTTILSVIVVGLRAYARISAKGQGWDDYLAYTALANVVFGAVVNQRQVHYGFGRHLVYVESTATDVFKWTIIAEIQSYSAVTLVKLSVCLFILRAIKGTHRNVAKFIYVLMVLVTMLGLAAMLTDVLQCFPLEKAWRPKLEGSCISPRVLTRLTEVFGGIGCATDFACVIIPIFIFNKLQINRRTKIAISTIMGLGLITGVCAIGKSVTGTFQPKDPTYDFVPVEIWAGVEGNFGLTVACLPALRPLFVNFLNGIWSGSKATSGKGSKGGKGVKPLPKLRSHALGRHHSDGDSDKGKLIPLGSIAVRTTMEVESKDRQSPGMESPRDMGEGYHSPF